MRQNTSTAVIQNQDDSSYLAASLKSPKYFFALDAAHLERASHPKRRKGKLPEIPAGYSASFTLDPSSGVHTAKPDGTALAVMPLRSLPAGVLTQCPIIHRRARHRLGYTVGREGGPAEGILCPMCKHIYYFLTLAPTRGKAFSNIGEYYEDIRKRIGLH